MGGHFGVCDKWLLDQADSQPRLSVFTVAHQISPVPSVPGQEFVLCEFTLKFSMIMLADLLKSFLWSFFLYVGLKQIYLTHN